MTKPSRKLLFIAAFVFIVTVTLIYAFLVYQHEISVQNSIAWVDQNHGHVIFSDMLGEHGQIIAHTPSFATRIKNYFFGENTFRNVVAVYLNGNVDNIKPLISFQELEVLDIAGTSVSDLSPINHLTHIKYLAIYNTPIENVAAIRRFSNLETLMASNSNICNISPLSELHQLKLLDLTNTKVNDITPLSKNNSLELLCISGTQVKKDAVKKLRRLLPGCRIVWEESENSSSRK